MNKRAILTALLFLVIALVAAQNESENQTNNLVQKNFTEAINDTLESTINTSPENITIAEELENIPTPDTIPVVASLKEKTERHTKKLNKKTREYFETVDESASATYLIKFKKKIKHLPDIEIQKEHAWFDVGKVRGNAGMIAALLDDNDITYVELDQTTTVLSDTIPYGVERINASRFWNQTEGYGVRVAILDTGIAPHDDLTIVGGNSTIGGDYVDFYGHGTAMAGVISAMMDDTGLVGAAPGADLYAIKIMNGSSGSLSDAISGLEWAIENNMSIVLMSFGMETYSEIFKEVLQDAADADIFLVAAAGNTGNETLYPAAYSSVIAVGSTDQFDQRAGFSAYGPDLELTAPGVDINSTTLNNSYAEGSGTSFSAAHVAGAAALIKSYYTSFTSEEVRAKLRNDALDLGIPGKDDYYGYGLVQVRLETESSPILNDSYYYEIYNTTDYGLADETRVFWLNGTGSIDEVSFSPGWYLVRKYLSDLWEEIIHVDENSSITQAVNIGFLDAFTTNSTTTDGYEWKRTAESTFSFVPSPDSSEDDAFCLDQDNNGAWDLCRYDSTNDLPDCMNYSNGLSGDGNSFYNICFNTPSSCSRDAGLDGGIVQDISSIKSQLVRLRWFRDCDDTPGLPSRSNGGASDTYYVFDQRKATCISGTQWQAKGRYQVSPDTFKIFNTLTCPSTKSCDFEQDESATTSETTNIDPCRLNEGETCSLTSECLTGLTCPSNVCTGNSTDIQIINIIPIQVIPGVDMVKDKSGFILVEVFNSGPKNATILVNATYDGSQLVVVAGQSQSLYIPQGATVYVNFSFKPNTAGSGKIITANATIAE